MTLIKLHALLIDAQDCADLETYLAECGGSVPAEYIGENGNAESAVELLTDLWQFRGGIGFRRLREYSEMYLAEFSRNYGIPLRTVENWNAGIAEPPAYLLELLLTDILNARKTEP